MPLTASEDYADWVAAHGWVSLLVVGLRLGCLNHALLSAESMMRRVPLAGWLANRLPPEQPLWADNVSTLVQRLPVPCLGVLPGGGADAAIAAIDIQRLRQALAV